MKLQTLKQKDGDNIIMRVNKGLTIRDNLMQRVGSGLEMIWVRIGFDG